MRRRPDFVEIAAVFAGGFAGAVLRAWLADALQDGRGDWPWATFTANVVGAFLLGIVLTRLPAAAYRRPLLGTGFCGALTTFSTLQVELVWMLDAGRAGTAALYAAASVAAGLGAVELATSLSRPRPVPR